MLDARRSDKYEIFPVEAIELEVGKRPALRTLNTGVLFVTDFQGPEQCKVSITFQGGKKLKKKASIDITNCITTNYMKIRTCNRLSKRAMCNGSSIACTETLLRSEGKRGRFRLGNKSPWYSCRKLATFFASHRSCMCLPKNTMSVLMVSCHLSAPHPIARFPPPRS